MEFVSTEFIKDLEASVLLERLKKIKLIKGTLGYLHFSSIAGSVEKVKVKQFGLSSSEKVVKVSK